MIEQHREMLPPGEGIVRDPGPNKQHQEYPKMMTHPGYRKGKPDVEIKEMNEQGQPTGRLHYRGGEAIRFAPVLVKDAMQEAFHASQGYENPTSCSAAAFARMVADTEPVPENYAPIEFPKYVFGKIVNNAVEEEARLIELNINKDGTPREAPSEPAAPALNTEANTLEVWPSVAAPSEEDEIAALEKKLADLKAKRAPEQASASTAYEERMNPPEANTTCDVQIAAPTINTKMVTRAEMEERFPPAPEQASASTTADDKAAKNAARVAKIKATMARKKAEREAAKAQEAA